MLALIEYETPQESQTACQNRLRNVRPAPDLRQARPLTAERQVPEVSLKDDEEPQPEAAGHEGANLAAEAAADSRAEAEPEAEEPAPEPQVRERHDGNHTPLKAYLREIGEVKLLTPQEEIELAARIKEGDKQARERMIKANLRLVVRIARAYENIGLPLLDLISEGNIGLMSAVERFDPAKGGKLSTYSAWWIKQAIKRALCNQSKTIRLPVNMIEKLSRMGRTALRLRQEWGREPTNEELGEELGVTARRVEQMRLAAIQPASLDASLADEDSNGLADVVQDESASTPYEQLEESTVTVMLRDMVQSLDARQATVLRARFGLDGGPEQTLQEVGRELGVTRERVRQLERLALKRLRKMVGKAEAERSAVSNTSALKQLLDKFRATISTPAARPSPFA